MGTGCGRYGPMSAGTRPRCLGISGREAGAVLKEKGSDPVKPLQTWIAGDRPMQARAMATAHGEHKPAE